MGQLHAGRGNGDGTFGVAVNFSQGVLGDALLVGDLNGDKKLDLVFSNSQEIAQSRAQSISAMVTELSSRYRSAAWLRAQLLFLLPISVAMVVPIWSSVEKSVDLTAAFFDVTASVYAGNGDGTFQSMPFYTVPLEQFSRIYSVAVGDVNAGGNPDLVTLYENPVAPTLPLLSL